VHVLIELVSIATVGALQSREPKRWSARMTFVTLSAGYGSPTIGVGYEFLCCLSAESRISQEYSEICVRNWSKRAIRLRT